MVLILNKLIEFQQQNPNIYIGGSIALVLQNAITPRTPKDIDIISPVRTHIFDIFNIKGREKHRIIRQYYDPSLNLRWELFNNPNAQYIEYIYNGHLLKLSPVDEIMKWKLKFQTKSPDNIKNNNDIKEWKNNF